MKGNRKLFASDIGKNNHELRQIDSEEHLKYGYATSDMKRDILKDKLPRVGLLYAHLA